MDGWNKEKLDNIGLLNILDEIEQYKYEIDNCVRGCRTNCHTYKELSDKFKELSEVLSDIADDLNYVKEDLVEDNE